MKTLLASVSYELADLHLSEEDHPNGMPFEGTLLLVDQPSDKSPHGAEGHRILVPLAAAERRLHTLVGMPLNYYSEGLDRHSTETPVGVISSAWIDYPNVKVKGVIWKKSFPKTEMDLHGRAQLGMSMELADVEIEDRDAHVWRLADFYFTGATTLFQKSAAYHKTTLAAAAAVLLGAEEDDMPTEKKDKAAAQNQAQALMDGIAASFATALKPLVDEVSAMRAEIKAGAEQKTTEETAKIENTAIQSLEAEVASAKTEIAAEKPVEEEEEEDESDESDDMEEEEDMDAKGKGVKAAEVNTEVKQEPIQAAAGMNPQVISTLNAAAETIRMQKQTIAELKAEGARQRKEIKALKNRQDAIEAQLEAAAERTGRKTITPELRHLLDKQGIEAGAIQDGTRAKLRVEDVDRMLASCGIQFDLEQRMRFKNELEAAGVMDEGFQRAM